MKQMMFAALLVVMSACSSSDEPQPTTTIAQRIVGTWNVDDYSLTGSRAAIDEAFFDFGGDHSFHYVAPGGTCDGVYSINETSGVATVVDTNGTTTTIAIVFGTDTSATFTASGSVFTGTYKVTKR